MAAQILGVDLTVLMLSHLAVEPGRSAPPFVCQSLRRERVPVDPHGLARVAEHVEIPPCERRVLSDHGYAVQQTFPQMDAGDNEAIAVAPSRRGQLRRGTAFATPS